MDYHQFLPSFSDFTKEVNDFHFSQEDIDFQKAKALEVGFDPWENYLKFIYSSVLNAFNLDVIMDGLVAPSNAEQKIRGSFPLLQSKSRKPFSIEVERISLLVEAFSVEDRDRVHNFEIKLNNLLLALLLQKHSDDPTKIEFIQAFTKDIEMQGLSDALGTTNEYGAASNKVNAFQFPKANEYINRIASANFYFPEKTAYLGLLHEGLLAENLIENNDDFEQSFAFQHRSTNVKDTLWLGSKTALFYLLYRLNNQKEYVQGVRIDKIAALLFRFRIEGNASSIRSNYTKALPKFNDPDYISKKMKKIERVCEQTFI